MLLALLLGTLAQAAPNPELLKSVVEAQPTCQNSLRYDDNNLYLGFGMYRRGLEEPRRKLPGGVKVTALNDPANPVRLETLDGVTDTIADGNTLYVLTYTAVEVWDLSSRQRTNVVPTYAAPEPWEYMEHARGFARYGDKAIIAHGRLGVSFFNLKTQRITNQFRLLDSYRPRESSAMDVTVNGKYAYVVFDDFTLSNDPGRTAFRGIVVIDMDSEKVVAELDGMDPGVDAVVNDGTSLVVSFWGLPLWKYSVADLAGRSLPNPKRRLWQFPYRGHPIGKPAMDAVNYYTCFRHDSEKRGEAPKFKPVALDRKALLLD